MNNFTTYFTYLVKVSQSGRLETEQKMENYFNHILLRQRIKFEKEYNICSVEKAKELIEFHWRHYRRQGGQMSEFIEELKKVHFHSFNPQNKDIFISFIEVNSENENSPVQKEIDPQTFDDIFTIKDWRKHIQILVEMENPVLDEDWNFIGSPKKHKGVICGWITDLKQKNIIDRTLSRQNLSKVLNYEIKNLNLGKDGKSFGIDSSEYRNNYKETLLKTLVN
jgi:hypothetical protein